MEPELERLVMVMFSNYQRGESWQLFRCSDGPAGDVKHRVYELHVCGEANRCVHVFLLMLLFQCVGFINQHQFHVQLYCPYKFM